jgi:hypothetical protein
MSEPPLRATTGEKANVAGVSNVAKNGLYCRSGMS